MAQRLIHYLLGEIFSEEIELKNKKRFLLGSIMPDAYMNLKDRDKTHFANRTEEQHILILTYLGRSLTGRLMKIACILAIICIWLKTFFTDNLYIGMSLE